MSDDDKQPDETKTDDAVDKTKPDEQQVPYDRFAQVNREKKEAADKAAKLEKTLADLQAKMAEKDDAGLPELERERKRAEQLEKQLDETSKRAEEADRKVVLSQRRALVLSAAAEAKFDDPTDATRFPEFVDLEEIETPDDAARAVKRLAKAKPRLLKDEEGPRLPGKVLGPNGQGATNFQSDIRPNDEAEMLAAELKKFRDKRNA